MSDSFIDLPDGHVFARCRSGGKACLVSADGLVDRGQTCDHIGPLLRRVLCHEVDDLSDGLQPGRNAVEVAAVMSGIGLGDPKLQLVEQHVSGERLVRSGH